MGVTTKGHRARLACIATALFLAVPLGTVDATGDDPVDPLVLSGFEELEEFIQGIPSDELNPGERNGFLGKLRNAEAKYEDGQTCAAHNLFGAFLNHAQAVRAAHPPEPVLVAEDLYNRGHGLRASFFDMYLQDAALVPPSPCFDAEAALPTGVQILASDNEHFAAEVDFGDPVFLTVGASGQTWTQMLVPGLENAASTPGLPNIPSWQALVAIPSGAEAMFAVPPEPVHGDDLEVNLLPAQDQAADQESGPEDDEYPLPSEWLTLFSDQPFAMDEAAYAMDAFHPPNPCDFVFLGQWRDTLMGQVQCWAGQYNPVSDELIVFDSVAFDLTFDGGDGTFATTQSISAFEPASSSALTAPLNYAVLRDHVLALDLSLLPCAGEEHMILTHPDFRAAADDLAVWKNDKGISTTVFEVGSGTDRDTGAEIDDLIEDRYQDCVVRPSYVTIIGDAEWVPPARTDYDTSAACGSCGDVTTGSDWGYADIFQFLFDVFPEIGVSRIPADTLTEAQTVVDKTIAYEQSPPFVNFGDGGPFYTTATVASQFQCCRMNPDGTPLMNAGRDQRSFVETSEVVRNALVGDGKTVERIYTQTIDDGGYCLVNQSPCPSDQVQQAYSGSTVPNRYYSNALMPADLRSGSGFAWDGDTNDIVSAFNAGRFNVLHRDHGSSSGWSNPAFGTGNLGSLSNGALLPVVYSVNCASGYWDRETETGGTTESFMERILTMSGGGMVGGIGDNRNSPTWANSAMTRGFYDATWTAIDPVYGSATPKYRLGDILNHGRVYLLTQIGVTQTAGSVSLGAATGDIIMYHAFGDATLEMWTENPYRLTLPLDFVLAQDGFSFDLSYAQEGAMITAFVDKAGVLEPYARASVLGGTANLVMLNPQPEPPSAEELFLVASYENSVPVVLQRPGSPDLVIRSIDIGNSTTVYTGEDLADRLKIEVVNIGDAGALGTIAPDATVQTGYMVDVVLSNDTSVPFGFASVPLPAGDAYAEDGLLEGGRVSRTPNLAAGLAEWLPAPAPVSSDVGGSVPEQAPTGDHYLCARIDPGDAVAESDEGNNVACIPVVVSFPPVPLG